MNRLPDTRRAEQCVYSQAHLLWMGILLFMMHLGSRRQLRFERLLIAHYITQLILHGSLIQSLCKTFGSAKNFARRLAESMRNHLSHRNLTMPGQIRFSVLADRQSQQPP